jgi:glycosyltransferase involved in cell wall biosynthesis
MLDNITPVLLTFNEAENLGRTLSHLSWAKDIVIVDSGSTDETLSIAKEFSQVRVFKREFDAHQQQWHYATHCTGISTPWILRLDADYQLSASLVEELSTLAPEPAINAYRIDFDYAVFSKTLISSLYPPNTILLRQGYFSVLDNGHTEAWQVEGRVGNMTSRVVHDDWKPVERWLLSQARYMRLETAKIAVRPAGLRDWLRCHPPLMPIVVFFYCLFAKGLILNGRAGLFYTLQRTQAEAILALMLIEKRLLAEKRTRLRRE